MGRVIAVITTSVDGYIAGPDDGPGQGLGVDGERLHYWVFGGPWTYNAMPDAPVDHEARAWLDAMTARVGAVVAGRWTYEAGDHWGGSNPWPVPLFIVTHRPEEQPDSREFTFVDGVEEAISAAKRAAGDRDVEVMGGADTIRQALAAGLVNELSIIIAPVVLGGGKQLFHGFTTTRRLEHLGVRQSPYATFIDYRVLPD